METCGADGLLGRPELAELLCRDVQAEVPAADAATDATDAAEAAAASGPSAFVAHEAGDETWDGLGWPGGSYGMALSMALSGRNRVKPFRELEKR